MKEEKKTLMRVEELENIYVNGDEKDREFALDKLKELICNARYIYEAYIQELKKYSPNDKYSSYEKVSKVMYLGTVDNWEKKRKGKLKKR